MPDPTPPVAGTANTDLLQLVAATADLCRRPLRHAVVPKGDLNPSDCCLQLACRDAAGVRQPHHDLELELFRSGTAIGSELNLTLAWLEDQDRPMLWQGQHPVWMDAAGLRCPRPEGGEPLEALARRLRALLEDGGR